MKTVHCFGAGLVGSYVARKLAELRSLCVGKNLNPDFVEELFGRIMEEVVKNHRDIDR